MRKRQKQKIAIIGHFGGGNSFNDGQTVKTKMLYDELSKVVDEDIKVVDTFYKKTKPLKLFLETIKTIMTTQNIIILISSNGMKIFFPILYIGKNIFKTKVFHSVVGGRFGTHIDKNPRFKKYLSSFDLNIVETSMLRDDFLKRGISNVEVIPNFRRLKSIPYDDVNKYYDDPKMFCTFSRVTKEKGIAEAIQAIEEMNSKYHKCIVRLDIYGPIDQSYASEFDQLLKNSSDAIQYKGEVKSKTAVDTLKDYYGVLFPTYWAGEGSAGTISESFFAGVPVIATNWRCNGEMITNGKNGIVYPSVYADSLTSGIEWLLQKTPEELAIIKKNCLDASAYYLPAPHISHLLEMMDL